MDPGAPLQFDAVPVPTPPGGPLAVELVPAPDPWDVAKKLAHLPHLLFLDSAEKHLDRGRYSYVAAEPVVCSSSWEDESGEAIRELQVKFAEHRQPTIVGLPPFQ